MVDYSDIMTCLTVRTWQWDCGATPSMVCNTTVSIPTAVEAKVRNFWKRFLFLKKEVRNKCKCLVADLQCAWVPRFDLVIVIYGCPVRSSGAHFCTRFKWLFNYFFLKDKVLPHTVCLKLQFLFDCFTYHVLNLDNMHVTEVEDIVMWPLTIHTFTVAENAAFSFSWS